MRGREQTCYDDRGCSRLPPSVSRPDSLSRWLILSSLVWLLGALPAAAASPSPAADAPDAATPWTLVVQSGRQAEPTQAEGLGHPDPQVRLTALEQWAQHREGDSVEPLTHALVDPDEQVRARAQELWEQALARQAEAAQVSERSVEER